MKTNILTKVLLFLPRKIFIAGKTRKEVLSVASRLNGEGFLTTIDVLGEHSKNEDEVEKALLEYGQLIDEIRESSVQSTISIKLTHLGLELDFGYCFNIVKDLVGYARQNNIGIEFDMEEYKYNPDTIEIFQSLSRPTDKNRICLQANIFKSANDLISLHDNGFQTRLVRGAYDESSDIALYDPGEINQDFISLISIALLYTVSDKNKDISGLKHAIGTRDKKIIGWAKDLIKFYSLDKRSMEFQLLYGYLPLGHQLLSEGYPVRIYLPYGDDQAAFPYVIRRLKTPHAWKLLLDWSLDFGKTH